MNELKRLLVVLRPMWFGMFAMLLLSTIVTVLGSAAPWIYREVVNFLTYGKLSDFWNRFGADRLDVVQQIGFIVGIYVAILLVQDALRVIRNLINRYLTDRVWLHIRLQSMKHLQELSMPFFYTHSVGVINEKIAAGSRESFSIVRGIMVDIWPALLRFVIAAIAIATLNVEIAVGLVVVMVLYSSLAIWRSKINKQSEEEVRPMIEEQGKKMISAISYQELVKQFGREESMESEFGLILGKIVRRRLRRSKTAAWIGFLEELLWKVVTVIVFGYGGYLVLVEKTLTLGDLILFIAYIDQVMNPLSYVFELYDQIQTALVSVKRLLKLWDTPVEVKDKEGATALQVKAGKVEMKGVGFYYRDGKGRKQKNPIFKNFNLTINPGETVALVGPSGAGKSTLIKLLLRFYDPDAGAVIIDGQDLKAVQQRTVRQGIASMMQDTVVFNDTVKANLKYANPRAKLAQMDNALKSASLYDFVYKLPKKLNTVLGERGLRLSGGERQRLGLARALLKDAPIIILDEATSALDSENEKNIQNAIAELIKNKTTIVIAHRLSTVKRADRIIVLNKGRVVEQGTHAELLKKKNGYYKKLSTMQEVLLKD